ncbi:hypothetical protein Kisp01_66070 [Kineosporia sp. NBRC 101677]|uniref:hypothetical protein n=1 Tax=Kineosporia sp. NBRC 101677 TaxID=3032197 RepID=UPI0024A09AEF|nr:hypothetical protein [Kineosporia sp. NBRC 101677]GLY19593.1 hypothetical protein Kisp01_66070 [Kineosporia sp. NBRC 101677]
MAGRCLVSIRIAESGSGEAASMIPSTVDIVRSSASRSRSPKSWASARHVGRLYTQLQGRPTYDIAYDSDQD